MSDPQDKSQMLINHDAQVVSEFLDPGIYERHDWRFAAALDYIRYGDVSSNGEILTRVVLLFLESGNIEELKRFIESHKDNDVWITNALVGMAGCKVLTDWVLSQLESGKPVQMLRRYHVVRAMAQMVLRMKSRADVRLIKAIHSVVGSPASDWPNPSVASRMQSNLRELALKLS